MKKSLIVVSALLSTLISNAASITWGAASALTTITSGSMYLVWANTAPDFSKLSDQSSFSSATITTVLGGTLVGDSATYGGSSLSATTVVKPGDPVSSMTAGPNTFYSMIISNDGKYMAYSSANNVPILNNTNAANISQAGSSFTTAEAVPEPFSGTLVLVGMAGLALRRKLKKQKKA